MKSCLYKSIWIVLPIVLFLLFSNAFAQQERIRSKNSEFYESRGLAYLEKHQYGKAISDFNKALKMNPGDASAYCNRGRAYGEQGQNDLAISNYTKALEINPGDAVTYYARGFSYYFKKENMKNHGWMLKRHKV